MRIFLLQVLVFLPAFLTFQVELILGKIIVPAFGGGYLVWGISVALYQGLLFLGYYHIHFLGRRFDFSRYRVWLTALLLLSVFLLPLNVERLQNPVYQLPAVLEIVYLLALTVGAPFFLLAGISIYAQIHLANSELPEKKNPYILFAASNLGSFAAILSYPLLVEPNFDTQTQLRGWETGYVGVAFLFAFVQWTIPARQAPRKTETAVRRPETRKLLAWLTLSAAGGAMFLSVTNEITFNIAPVPLLWILPLATYLLTFVLVFKKKAFCPRYLRDRFYFFVFLAVVLFLFNLMGNSILEYLIMGMLRFRLPWYEAGTLAEPFLLLSICFVFCLVCHHGLQKEKPRDPGQLTVFYLIVSVGGFLGGALVNWIVPLAAHTVIEILIACLLGAAGFAILEGRTPENKARTAVLALAGVALVFAWSYSTGALPPDLNRTAALVFSVLMFAVLFLLKNRHIDVACVLAALICVVPFVDFFNQSDTVLFKQRNYYGVYKVSDRGLFRRMMHGSVLHGAQFVDPEKRRRPLTYFHPRSPAGKYFATHAADLKRAAVVGLGAGALAAYAKKGDRYDFYELDPQVGKIAEQYFFYVPDARARGAQVNFVFGDARVSLRHRQGEPYDVMAVDVFNSGSIPVHLLTYEAILKYRRHLKPEALLFFHVSNEYLDLLPVLSANARKLGWAAVVKSTGFRNPPEEEQTVWVALSPDRKAADHLKKEHGWRDLKTRRIAPWTDRYSSLLSVLDN